jgi:hypothetical protein
MEVVGCLSKVRASNHFRRNNRAVLVGDDLVGVSRKIHARTIDGKKKHFCIPNEDTTPNYINDNLVAAYLLPNPDGTNRQPAAEVFDPTIRERSCTINGGVATQTRRADDSWGPCTLLSCNSGYNRFGNLCFQSNSDN